MTTNEENFLRSGGDFKKIAADDSANTGAPSIESESDPELEAEVKYAKEHSGGDPNNLPMRLRLKLARKAKELEDASRQVNGVVQVPRSLKNQRKSRTAKRKGGAPKKAGNGGKWTWGRAENLYEEPEFVDSDDPNYDSDSHGRVKFQEITPELGEGKFEHYVESIVLEYFGNGDLKNAVESLDELNLSKSARPGVVRLAVTLAMDHKPSAKELVSQFFAELHSADVISKQDAVRGFLTLLNVDLPDLAIDYLDASDVVGNFLARAVADEVIPHEFLVRTNGTTISSEELANKLMSNQNAKSAVEKAEVMLQQKHRLDTIWCPGGGTRPVRQLATKIKDLIEEYLSSGDLHEATRCLIDLEVPHFHHEVVFQAGVRTIEAMHERTARSLSSLLRHLSVDGQLPPEAWRVGFDRLFVEMPELCLDVPPAYTLLERWLAECQTGGFLPDDVKRKAPQKGRKRMVSEGDGGRLKVVDVPPPSV